MKDIKGKIAVITGASRGIGRAAAVRLAAAGAVVVPIARSKDKLDALIEEIRASGGKGEAFACDLTDPDATRDALKKIEAQHGSVDILVNNVGVGTFKPLDRIPDDEVIGPIMIPVAATLIACHAVIPGMLKRGSGHIVNLTSPSGYFHLPYMLPYAAARHAIVGMTLSLYEEMRGRGVGVTLMCPPKVNTGYFNANDADLDWFPRISKLFPTVEPEVVGEKIYKSIVKNQREVLFPFVTWFFVRYYQTMPRFTRFFLGILGLWKPARKDTPK